MKAALRHGALGVHVVLQVEALERRVAARLRQGHDGVVANEREPAGKSRAEGHLGERARCGVEVPQVPGAGVEQPQAPVVPPGGVGHGEAVGDHLARSHVHHHAAAAPVVAPASQHVAARCGRRVGEVPVKKCHAVEVAAVAGGDLADERRRPHHAESVALAQLGDAVVLRVDHQHAPVGVARHVVHVDVAGDMSHPGHVQRVVAVVRRAGVEDVLKPPHLEGGAHPQPLGLSPQSHGALKGALEHRQHAVGAHAHEEELAGLIRGECETAPHRREPVRQLARGEDRYVGGRGAERLGHAAVVPDTPNRDVRRLGLDPAHPSREALLGVGDRASTRATSTWARRTAALQSRAVHSAAPS